MDVSKNRGTPKSSILIGFFIINHPFLGTPIFGNTYVEVAIFFEVVTNETLFSGCKLSIANDKCHFGSWYLAISAIL